MTTKDIDNVPFHSWNCLTLCLARREVDLVIRDDQDMSKVLKFLIWKMKTVDGNKDSSLKLLQALNLQSIENEKKTRS